MSARSQRRLPGRSRKFGSLRILGDGRIRYSAWSLRGLESLIVSPNYQYVDLDDKVVENASTYTVWIYWSDRPIFLLSVTRHRVTETQFTHLLTPDQLRDAVSVIRRLGNGVEKWITPGLAHLQYWMAPTGSEKLTSEKRAVLEIIPGLLRSVRSIPIARPWRPLQLKWERWKREQAQQRRRKKR